MENKKSIRSGTTVGGQTGVTVTVRSTNCNTHATAAGMAMKEWFRRLQPVQLYLMLALSIAFVLTELVVSHITHALTLMVGAFHMLCNIIALAGCLITIKYGKDSQDKHTKHKKHERNKVSDINNTLHGSHTSIGEVLTSRQQTAATPDGDSNRLKKSAHAHAHSHSHDHSTLLQQQPSLLKNTFGWARIDVIVMLICFVFLASLCFSLLLEALQTLVHIDHHDEMHHPIPVMCVGAIGLLLNGLCYLLIGGYTFHQGSFLHVTASGDVVLDRVVTKDSVKQGQRRLSRSRLQSASSGGGASTVPQPISTTNHPQHATIFTQTTSSVVPSADIITTTTPIIIMDNQQTSSPKSSGEDASAKTQVYTTKKAHENSNFNSSGSECSRNRQGAREMTRDVLSCVYVIICSLIVYYTENPVAKFVDPVVSIISATHLLWLSYPYMKESGLILLQTMPDTINIDSLKSELLAAFPDIVNIHDLHVWQLTANKIISTAHIIFQDPKVYAKITKEVNEFFISQGITQVTVQPEFSQIYMNKKGEILRQKSIVANHEIPDVGEDHKCLMRCQGIDCTSKHCCAQHDSPKDNTKIHKRWTTSKEIIPSNSIHDLKSIRIHPFELVVRSSDIPPEAAAAPTTTPSSSTPTNRSLSMSPSANQRIQQVGDNTATNNLSKYSKSAQDIHRCTNEHDCDRRNSTLHSNYDSLNNVSSSGTTTSNVIVRNCDNNLNLSSSDTILTSSTQNVNSSTSSNNNTIIVNQETN